MTDVKFEGTWTALVTPMSPGGGIDWDGFRKNIDFQTSQGISGILPVGTTGESPTLDWNEHKEVIGKAIEYSGARCAVIAGCGSNSTEETVAAVASAKKMGAGAVLLVDCYYNGPSSLELRKEYYEPVAKEFPDIYIVPYIIPGRTGTALSPEDVALLSWKFPNISAVKEATGDTERMRKTRCLAREDFSILSGDDDITFNIMIDPRIRASGVISVIANIIPGAIGKMAKSVLSGEQGEAREIHEKIQPLLSAVTVKCRNERVLPEDRRVLVEDRFRNPVPVKTMMNGLGMPAGPCRRPLGRMSRAGVETARSALRAVWEKDPAVLEPVSVFYKTDIEERLGNDSYWEAQAYYD